MWRYVLKRCLWLIFVLIGTAIVIFTILYFIPGDITTYMLGSNASAEELAALRERLGLNDPYLKQLGDFLYQTFIKFDFGTSIVYNQPITVELFKRMPRTILLGWSCVILNAAVGIPLGRMAALHQNKWQDRLCMSIALIGVSIPSFWLALELIMVFSINLGWLPPYGIGGIKYYILPIIASAIGPIAVNARQTRSSFLEVMRADYISTARAKGVSEKDVINKHMMPNALIPIITNLGAGFANSIAGTVIIENIFAIPGVGQYLVTGINTRDYTIVRGSVIIIAFMAAVIQLIVDIIYAQVDPRIKAQYSGQMGGVSK